MAVTKQVYTLSPTWTASGLASLFRSAFIDAGLMTEWYDDFLSGSVENRILEVVNDGTKTYGTVYYWFMFTTTEVRVHTALGWDTTTNVPTGTQYQDYYSTTTNSTTTHELMLGSLAASTSLTLTRYTSAINTSCTWFVFSQASSIRFLIPYGAYTATSFVDQNITAFNGIVLPTTTSASYFSTMTFMHYAGHTRRTFLGAASLNGSTSSTQYRYSHQLQRYASMGNVAGQGASNTEESYITTWLPTARTNTHTGLAADYTPVFTSIQCSAYLPALPADFAMTSYYASTAIANGDTFIVSAGTEEYEVILASKPSSSATNASPLIFLARTVG